MEAERAQSERSWKFIYFLNEHNICLGAMLPPNNLIWKTPLLFLCLFFFKIFFLKVNKQIYFCFPKLLLSTYLLSIKSRLCLQRTADLSRRSISTGVNRSSGSWAFTLLQKQRIITGDRFPAPSPAPALARLPSLLPLQREKKKYCLAKTASQMLQWFPR